uniref:Lipoprotein n=1 Tax=Haemonchus contortus TaxID=6289 RepID=A0A7I5E909_HAECO
MRAGVPASRGSARREKGGRRVRFIVLQATYEQVQRRAPKVPWPEVRLQVFFINKTMRLAMKWFVIFVLLSSCAGVGNGYGYGGREEDRYGGNGEDQGDEDVCRDYFGLTGCRTCSEIKNAGDYPTQKESTRKLIYYMAPKKPSVMYFKYCGCLHAVVSCEVAGDERYNIENEKMEQLARGFSNHKLAICKNGKWTTRTSDRRNRETEFEAATCKPRVSDKYQKWYDHKIINKH